MTAKSWKRIKQSWLRWVVAPLIACLLAYLIANANCNGLGSTFSAFGLFVRVRHDFADGLGAGCESKCSDNRRWWVEGVETTITVVVAGARRPAGDFGAAAFLEDQV